MHHGWKRAPGVPHLSGELFFRDAVPRVAHSLGDGPTPTHIQAALPILQETVVYPYAHTGGTTRFGGY